jgi:hypothetical protein
MQSCLQITIPETPPLSGPTSTSTSSQTFLNSCTTTQSSEYALDCIKLQADTFFKQISEKYAEFLLEQTEYQCIITNCYMRGMKDPDYLYNFSAVFKAFPSEDYWKQPVYFKKAVQVGNYCLVRWLIEEKQEVWKDLSVKQKQEIFTCAVATEHGQLISYLKEAIQLLVKEHVETVFANQNRNDLFSKEGVNSVINKISKRVSNSDVLYNDLLVLVSLSSDLTAEGIKFLEQAKYRSNRYLVSWFMKEKQKVWCNLSVDEKNTINEFANNKQYLPLITFLAREENNPLNNFLGRVRQLLSIHCCISFFGCDSLSCQKDAEMDEINFNEGLEHLPELCATSLLSMQNRGYFSHKAAAADKISISESTIGMAI